ncbi:MAG: hypothetical protein AB1806_18640 [Acidobacteriota bacterium]
MADPVPSTASPDSTRTDQADTPRYRPSDQFWPYANLPEQPSDEELARLDPDLQAALYESPPAVRFSYTIVFAPFDGPDYERAVSLAEQSDEYLDVHTMDGRRHRARYVPDQVVALRDLWQIVGRFDTSEVLVDGRPVPYARELWLPLLWYLIPR